MAAVFQKIFNIVDRRRAETFKTANERDEFSIEKKHFCVYIALICHAVFLIKRKKKNYLLILEEPQTKCARPKIDCPCILMLDDD